MTDRAAAPPRAGRASGQNAAGAAALLLVVAAFVVGAVLIAHGVPLYAGSAPLFGEWLPHAGPGTPAAVVVAAAVVALGPSWAQRLSWPRLLAAGYVTAVVWTFALAMVDGWQPGVAGRLTLREEYLHEVPGITDAPAMIAAFTGRILDHQPDSWTVHVAGHPPAALLVFVGLDRVGLGGGAAAALVCLLVGASVVVSVPVTLRALGAGAAARRAVPFLALFPGAVWVGVSADALFAGVAAAAVALLAVGAARGWLAAAFAGGVLLGCGLYLSYGLVLMALPALAVLWLARREAGAGAALAGALGVLAVIGVFTAAGFWWLDGYHLVVQRYYQGIGAQRPYGYWVWANLAALVLCAGPAAAAAAPALRSAAPALRHLVVAAALAVVLADLSGLSKAETERIWLPFAVWLTAGAAAVDDGRRWLAAGAMLALAVNHLVLTRW